MVKKPGLNKGTVGGNATSILVVDFWHFLYSNGTFTNPWRRCGNKWMMKKYEQMSNTISQLDNFTQSMERNSLLAIIYMPWSVYHLRITLQWGHVPTIQQDQVCWTQNIDGEGIHWRIGGRPKKPFASVWVEIFGKHTKRCWKWTFSWFTHKKGGFPWLMMLLHQRVSLW